MIGHVVLFCCLFTKRGGFGTTEKAEGLGTEGLFSKVPNLFWAYFGSHKTLCIFKRKTFQVMKFYICSIFCFVSVF